MALVTCPDCGNSISSEAPACPHCGRPFKAAHKVTLPPPKRGIGCGGAILIVVGIAVVAGMVMESVDPTPRAKPPKAATSEAASDDPDVAALDKSPKMQAERKALLEKLQISGGMTTLDCRANGATMAVTPDFQQSTFETQQSLASVAWAYCFDGTELAVVRLVDSRTRKAYGTFSPAGLEID